MSVGHENNYHSNSELQSPEPMTILWVSVHVCSRSCSLQSFQANNKQNMSAMFQRQSQVAHLCPESLVSRQQDTFGLRLASLASH